MANYNTKYSMPGGRVKVFPTTGHIVNPYLHREPAPTAPVSNDRLPSTGNNFAENKNNIFKLPPPPSKPRPNKINKPIQEILLQVKDQKFTSTNQERRQGIIHNNDYIQRETHLPAVSSSLPLMPGTTHSQITPNGTDHKNSGSTRVNEGNGGTPSDMKKLQYELAQLKLELASMSELIKEDDEWLKVQSQQVKELAHQQHKLQTSLNFKSEPARQSSTSNNSPSLPPLPTTPKPIRMKVTPHQKNEGENPKALSTDHSVMYSNKTQEKAPMSITVSKLVTSTSQKPISSVQRNEDKPTSREGDRPQQLNTVNVKRISGIFEATFSSNEIPPKANFGHPVKKSGDRRSVIEIFTEGKHKTEENSDNQKSLSRSKSMYCLKKPPPSPKPVFNRVSGDYSKSSFNSARGKIQTFHNQNQHPDAEEERAKPPIESRQPPTLPSKSLKLSKNTPSSIFQRKLPQIPVTSQKVSESKVMSQSSVQPPTEDKVSVWETVQRSNHISIPAVVPFKSPETQLSLQERTSSLHKPRSSSPQNFAPNLRPSSTHELSLESSLHNLNPDDALTTSPQKFFSNSRPSSPRNVIPVSRPSSPPPPPPNDANRFSCSLDNYISSTPPPPPLPLTLLQTAIHNRTQSNPDDHLPHQDHSRSHSVPNIAESEGLKFSKSELLQQIREFGNSGKSLKKTESINSNGSTPQSPKKNMMHDALQTRFQAFCGNDSNSSDSEPDNDNDSDYWDE